MLQGGLHSDAGLHTDVLNLAHEIIWVKSLFVLLHMLKNSRQGAFCARVIVNVIVLHKIFGPFVDCVISQVHEQLFDVLFGWFFVFSGCEAGKTLLENEYAHWVRPVKKRVNAQVKLETVNKVGLGHVALCH